METKNNKGKLKPEEAQKPPYYGEPVSEHISWDEAVMSATAKAKDIDNTPPPEIWEQMKETAKRLFEPLRRFWRTPIAVVSFYRCPELNKAIRGAKKSQHMKGQAIDIDARVYGNISNRQVFEYILNELVFDQLIWEKGSDNEPDWVHVSISDNPRYQALRRRKVKGRWKYESISSGR